MVVWLAVTFVVAQLVAGVWFDYVQPRVRFAHLYRELDVLERQAAPTVLCLGSSRFGTCLDDAAMTKRLGNIRVVNLGVPLGDLVASENVLEQALWRGVKPRLVLLEVSPEFVSAHNTWLTYHVERHLRWDHVPRFGWEVLEQGQVGKWFEERLLPFYVHRKGYWNAWGDMVQLAFKRAKGGQVNWERTLEVTATTRALIGNPKIEAVLETLRPSFRDYRPGGATARALERVLARCRREGIEVMLIAPPLRSDHRRLYSEQVEATFRTYVERLGLPFWDGRKVLADERFLDNQHADAEGRREFTVQLCSQAEVRERVRRVRGE
jgi:hypothetical protein